MRAVVYHGRKDVRVEDVTARACGCRRLTCSVDLRRRIRGWGPR